MRSTLPFSPWLLRRPVRARDGGCPGFGFVASSRGGGNDTIVPGATQRAITEGSSQFTASMSKMTASCGSTPAMRARTNTACESKSPRVPDLAVNGGV